MKDSPLTGVLEILDPPTGFSPWHGGPTLMGSLRGVNFKQAAWKPAEDRHSIWELALHIAYWKYRVRRYMNPRTEKGFGRSPANWPVVDEPTEETWKRDKALIKQEHEKLIEEIKAFPESRLNERFSEKKGWNFRQLLEGAAAHDTYHIAQIQLMKRLYAAMNNE
ncbi:MAG TPA: DinB family protein [Balneolaceae bacterium]|nr:DinB family protein [Balneolaceae bacterium]